MEETTNTQQLPIVYASRKAEGKSLGPLPWQWEERMTAKGGKIFVDHRHQKTQWIDPRTCQLPSDSIESAIIFSELFRKKKHKFTKLLHQNAPSGVVRLKCSFVLSVYSKSNEKNKTISDIINSLLYIM